MRAWASSVSSFLAFAFLGTAGASAQPQPLDPSDVQVNTYTTNDQQFSDVATDAGGNFVVVWQSFGSSGTDQSWTSIQARRFRRDGTPIDAADTQVNTLTTLYQMFPRVARAPDGSFLVVWPSNRSAGSDHDGWSMQGRRFGPDGSPLDPVDFQVNALTAYDQWGAAAAADPAGNFVVVWTTVFPNYYGGYVHARRFRGDGSPLDTQEFVVNTQGIGASPSVAVNARGEFVVAWESYGSLGNDGSYTSIQARRYKASGQPLDPTEFQVNTYTPSYQFGPSVAAAPSGAFVVAWSSVGSSGNDRDGLSVQSRRFDSAGVPLDAVDVQLNTLTSGDQDSPRIALDPEGNGVVVWTSEASAGGDDSFASVQGRRFRADGRAVDGAEFQVNTFTPDSQYLPTAATTLDGDFVVTWSSLGTNGTDWSESSVQVRRFGRPTLEVTSPAVPRVAASCTLHDAIVAANTGTPSGGCQAGNGGAVISLPANARFSITAPADGSNGLPPIESSITILGHGSTIERDPGLACPVAPEFRLFEVVEGGILSLDDVAVRNGCVAAAPGGGLLASGGTIVLRGASVEGNESGASGGGLALEGGNLFAIDATLRGNLAGLQGGAASLAGDAGTILVQGSTLTENAASNGGGISLSAAARLLLRNSTVSGNEALTGGGLEVEGPGSQAAIEFSTLTANAAASGAGLSADAGRTALHGSLVGDNVSGEDCAASVGLVSASGANLDTDGSCASLAGSSVLTVPSLELGPLADNGGPTRTHLPTANSPALHAAPACTTSFGSVLLEDQRGYPRPGGVNPPPGPACDLGSVERLTIFLDGFERGSAADWSRYVP